MLAHELSHVANRDVLVMTLASFFAMLAALLTRVGLYGGMFSGGRNRDGGAPAWLIIFLVSIVDLHHQLPPHPDDLSLPRVRSRSRLGAHHRRARAADERAPEDRERHGSDSPARSPRGRGMNAFFIIPTNVKSSIGELFATHPPLEKRLAVSPRSPRRWAGRSSKRWGWATSSSDGRSSRAQISTGCSRSPRRGSRSKPSWA